MFFLSVKLLSVLKKGRDLSVPFDKKRLRDTNFPLRLWPSSTPKEYIFGLRFMLIHQNLSRVSLIAANISSLEVLLITMLSTYAYRQRVAVFGAGFVYIREINTYPPPSITFLYHDGVGYPCMMLDLQYYSCLH
nr:hypothetical protein [Tanacetum cinerariifolium]